MTGADLGTYQLRGATLIDWEDLAIGPGPEVNRHYLYVADTGANAEPREYVSVYRVEEPTVTKTQVSLPRELKDVTRFDFTYPDGVSFDTEAMMVDPITANVYLITKPRRGSPFVFRGTAPLIANQRTPLERVAVLSTIGGDFILPPLVTGASISRDGRNLLVRTYLHAYLWQREIAETVEAALLRTPCEVPLSLEPQGEAIAFAVNGNGYFTTSEGHHPKLNFFERKPAPPQ
jgi:hypothetical protein